jgi:hypothetical protein
MIFLCPSHLLVLCVLGESETEHSLTYSFICLTFAYYVQGVGDIMVGRQIQSLMSLSPQEISKIPESLNF